MASPTSRVTELHPILRDRWSPRAFDPDYEISTDELVAMLEAARWAPSSMNRQPWRFAVTRRGESAFEEVFKTLMAGNQIWAGNASAFIVALVAVDGHHDEIPSIAAYDVGQSVAQLSVQAQASGLHTHQMGGFDKSAITTALDLPADVRPMVVIAVGKLGDPAQLSDQLRAREAAPRHRLALQDIVLGGVGVHDEMRYSA